MVNRLQEGGLKFDSPRKRMQLCSQVRVSKPFIENHPCVIKRCRAKALWDTGAVTSGISRKLADKLNLRVYEQARLATTAGEVDTFNDVVLLDLFFDETVIPVKVVVIDSIPGEGIDFLIGMDVIQCGDLTITTDHASQRFNVCFTPYAGLFNAISDIIPYLPKDRFLDL